MADADPGWDAGWDVGGGAAAAAGGRPKSCYGVVPPDRWHELPTEMLVTFLVTDVEGSTRLWEVNPHTHEAAPMVRAIDRHNDIWCRAIQDHGGWVYRNKGDEFCAAFRKPWDAVAAALAAQRAMAAEDWGPVVRAMNVRAAVSTGQAYYRAGDYYGPDVNRVFRL